MSLAEWTAARDSNAALRKLSKLPESVTGHGVAVPFPVVDRKAYKAKFSNREINGAIDSGKVLNVPIKKLNAIQYSVRASRVEKYVQDPNLVKRGTRDKEHGGLVDLPVVIKFGGKLYLHDGHHRATAAKLSGADRIKVRVADLDMVQRRGD